MTFTKWWKENQNTIESNVSCQNFTGIKADFEACWHDGYKQARHLTRHSSGRANLGTCCGVTIENNFKYCPVCGIPIPPAA